MHIMIIATKSCAHRNGLERELDHLRITYRTYFAEDCAELVQRFDIRHSPNLVVDGEVVFRNQPTEVELHAYFDKKYKLSLVPEVHEGI